MTLVVLKVSVEKRESKIPSLQGLDSDLIAEVTAAVRAVGGEVTENRKPSGKGHGQIRRERDKSVRHGWVPTSELIIALGSAGVFSAAFQAICRYFEKDRNRSITVEIGKKKVVINGHKLPEERELIDYLLPEFKREAQVILQTGKPRNKTVDGS